MVKFNFGLGDDDNTANGNQAADPQSNTSTTSAGDTAGADNTRTAQPVQQDEQAPVQTSGEATKEAPEKNVKPQEEINFNITDDTTPAGESFTPIQDQEEVQPVTNGINFDFSQTPENASAPTDNQNDILPENTDISPAPQPAPVVSADTTPAPDFSQNTVSQDFSNTQDTSPQTKEKEKQEEIPAVSPFQQEDRDPVVEATNINPFATPEEIPPKDNTGEDAAFLGPQMEEVQNNDFSTSNTSNNSDDPFPSLEEVKKGVSAFVQSHFDNIKSYKKQINELKDKIRKEEDILRTKKDEFNNLVREIKGLADSFDESLPNDNGQNKGKHNVGSGNSGQRKNGKSSAGPKGGRSNDGVKKSN